MKTKLIHSGQELSQTGTEIRARKRQWERGHRETAYASAACASASVSLIARHSGFCNFWVICSN